MTCNESEEEEQSGRGGGARGRGAGSEGSESFAGEDSEMDRKFSMLLLHFEEKRDLDNNALVDDGVEPDEGVIPHTTGFRGSPDPNRCGSGPQLS